MTKIDLDEIEASLGYLEDWKKVIAELRAARKVVEAVKQAIANTPHTDDCFYWKDRGIECKCWQREVAESLKELEDGEK